MAPSHPDTRLDSLSGILPPSRSYWRGCAIAICLVFCACGRGSSSELAGNPPYQPVQPDEPAGALTGDANFFNLITKYSRGQVTPTPWAGYWWPFSEDGTANADAKYESVIGTSGATSWEKTNHGPNVPGIQDWWGHCNGWSAAAVLHPEPTAALTRGSVTFSVGDQKALLSEIAMEVDGDFFGHRETDPNDFTSLTYQDVFPDQFFLVLTNIVGSGRPLIIDRYTGVQVWNQPVVGYQIDPVTSADYLGADPSSPDVYRVMITLQVWWASDSVPGEYVTQPFQFADNDSFQSRVLTGEIWLDAPPQFDASGKLVGAGNVILTSQNGYVLGGQWHNGVTEGVQSHPDYMWIPFNEKPSTGYSNPDLDITQVKNLLGL